MLYPLLFHPIFKERVWGGRKLAELFHKPIPPGLAIGESWEISDRPGDVSVVANGSLAGRDLQWLMKHHGEELLGPAFAETERFPLLIKILDAREKLSVQVHPPQEMALKLGGEPKTELWYIVDAAPGAELYVGLKEGIDRMSFEQRLRAGTVAECVHRVNVRTGDAMFLPSGRIHAIGAGLVIFEIQQNSDTTYRVFDWNRAGLDGKPRALHVEESLASIDFDDFEPAVISHEAMGDREFRPLVNHAFFRAQVVRAGAARVINLSEGVMHILGIIDGRVKVVSGDCSVALTKGQFCLVPASTSAAVHLEANASLIQVQPGE